MVFQKSTINTITTDGSGRFVASSDNAYCINVWDRDAITDGSPVAIRTIYEPFKSNEINAVGLSHDARYLIAACSGTQNLLKVWQWTIGNDSPDGISLIKLSFIVLKLYQVLQIALNCHLGWVKQKTFVFVLILARRIIL